MHPLKIAKLDQSSRVEFGPLAFYHPLVADGDTPVRTGIQTSAPGYVAPMHFHPYTELLFIIEGPLGTCAALLLLRARGCDEAFGVGDEAANLMVHCDSCGTTRSLVEAFGDAARDDPLFGCRGRRPHLRDFEPGGCGEQAETMLLGASNSWFGITLSALSIPRHADRLPQLVEEKWVTLQHVTSTEVLAAFRVVGNLRGFEEYDDATVWRAIEGKRSGTGGEAESTDLKEPEWQVFSSPDPTRNSSDFELTPVAPPAGFEAFFEKVVGHPPRSAVANAPANATFSARPAAGFVFLCAMHRSTSILKA